MEEYSDSAKWWGGSGLWPGDRLYECGCWLQRFCAGRFLVAVRTEIYAINYKAQCVMGYGDESHVHYLLLEVVLLYYILGAYALVSIHKFA